MSTNDVINTRIQLRFCFQLVRALESFQPTAGDCVGVPDIFTSFSYFIIWSRSLRRRILLVFRSVLKTGRPDALIRVTESPGVANEREKDAQTDAPRPASYETIWNLPVYR